MTAPSTPRHPSKAGDPNKAGDPSKAGELATAAGDDVDLDHTVARLAIAQFALIPTTAIDDPRVTDADLRVLAVLAATDHHHDLDVRANAAAVTMRTSTRVAHAHIAALRAFGYLTDHDTTTSPPDRHNEDPDQHPDERPAP